MRERLPRGSKNWRKQSEFFFCALTEITYDTQFCRRKLQNKVKSSDESYSELQTKYSSLEKAKNHIAAELEDLNIDLEKVRVLEEEELS